MFVVNNGVDIPQRPLVQMPLVRLRRYLGLEKITQVSFAEYHSKRNPVERVHTVEEKELAKHGPFTRVTSAPETVEHRQAMKQMAEEVSGVFSHGRFGISHYCPSEGSRMETSYLTMKKTCTLFWH